MIDIYKGDNYRVSLVTGNIEFVLNYYPITAGPYKYCNTLIEADLYSLNILRQNAAEKDLYKIPGSQLTRSVLDFNEYVQVDEIIPRMKYLKDEYAEVFI